MTFSSLGSLVIALPLLLEVVAGGVVGCTVVEIGPGVVSSPA